MLSGTRPNKATPLAESLNFLNRRIALYTPALLAADKMMFLTVITDGVPTPLVWSHNRSQKEQLQEAKDRAISELYQAVGRFPVSLVVRLCTNDDDAVDFWNNLDDSEEFSLDVIDDMLGEANEVSGKGNSFFVYSPAIHRFREGGFNNRLFDLMDEKRFMPRQRAQIMSILLAEPDTPLPMYTSANFNAEVKARASRQPTVWNPKTRNLDPCVDPTRGSGQSLLVPFFFKLLFAIFLLAFVLRSVLAPSTPRGSGYPPTYQDQYGQQHPSQQYHSYRR
mmetsp:Transcript_7367/g.21770  ORF Transcript_7367/g.21770 Transcript_7367/m.21770 type:complete len:279 (-) Transcript_7367:3255-4091(-)